MLQRDGVFSASLCNRDIIEQRQYTTFDSSVGTNKASLRHLPPTFFLGL
jgi:hypothetical protein